MENTYEENLLVFDFKSHKDVESVPATPIEEEVSFWQFVQSYFDMLQS